MSLARAFQPPEAFCPRNGTYRLLPFRFERWSESEVFLTNEVGEYTFLSRSAFEQLVSGQLDRESADYRKLKAQHVLLEGTSTVPLELLATKVRTKRSFLEGFTKLHLFVVTLRCDHSCRYCQVSRVSQDRSRFDMSRDTAERAIELMFRSPSPQLKVEIQGGESLLNFDLIRYIVTRVSERNLTEGRDVQFVVATNLAPLTDLMLSFFGHYGVFISTSLDGPEGLHNRNRPRPGNDSHALTIANLKCAREALGEDLVAAVMTATEASLEQPQEIVDEYVRLGFSSIFLRAISPYGFAVRTGEALRYDTARFLNFYRAALDRIIEVNREGNPFVETYSQILLTKILTPFSPGYVDLQSPSGAVLGAVAYNYDGDVYASDEARMLGAMGDLSFRLGNVHKNSFEEIFGGEIARGLAAASVQECLPGCAECAFLPYCGSDPVFHYRTQGDAIGHRPSSAFCQKHMGILRHLLALLRGGDRFTRDLLTGWAVGADPPSLAEGRR